jgi:SAM-dependent methyltransferase
MGEISRETMVRVEHTTEVAPPAGALPYVCPRCKGPLAAGVDAYDCPACVARYPIVLGIPDFRVFPDPWIEYEDDREKARTIAARAGELDFAGLVEYYWRITPNTPLDLARRYISHVMAGVERGRSSLDEIGRLARDLPADAPFLELGCGTGGFLVAAAERFERVVGIDIALRWLVIARKRLEEAGVTNAQLVCCCGEYLPFPEGQFGLVVASDVIEHTATQEELVRGALRALRPGGVFFFATPNRLSLTPEPHVRVWGVGFLPRRLMPAYVRLVKRLPYRHIRILSFFEIRALLRRAGARRYRIVLPRISAQELPRFSGWERRGVELYHALLDLAPARYVFYVFGPFFHVLVRREATRKRQ